MVPYGFVVAHTRTLTHTHKHIHTNTLTHTHTHTHKLTYTHTDGSVRICRGAPQNPLRDWLRRGAGLYVLVCTSVYACVRVYEGV